MKKLFSFSAAALSLIVIFIFSGCTNNGKKVSVEGTKGEVYYVDSATENEAQKLGNFLKQYGYFGNVKTASVQIDKKNDNYLITFVYDKDYYQKTQGLEDFFKNYTVRMSRELFDGKKVDIALADKYFKDFKNIPYDESAANAPANSPGATFNASDYNHQTVGDVNFYWKGLSNVESKPIVDYISQNGSFSGGTAEIYMTKEGDRYILKFPVKEEYQNDTSIISEIEKVSKEIKDNVFPNDPYSFKMTDVHLNPLRSFDY